MPPAGTDPSLGAIVEVPAGRGIVRFCGATSFSPGKWVGIELSEPNGKNDGTVQGVKYFTCKPQYGVFVRPSQVKVIAATPEPAPPVSSSGYFCAYMLVVMRHASQPLRERSGTSVPGACLVPPPPVPFRLLARPVLLNRPPRHSGMAALSSPLADVTQRRVSTPPRNVYLSRCNPVNPLRVQDHSNPTSPAQQSEVHGFPIPLCWKLHRESSQRPTRPQVNRLPNLPSHHRYDACRLRDKKIRNPNRLSPHSLLLPNHLHDRSRPYE